MEIHDGWGPAPTRLPDEHNEALAALSAPRRRVLDALDLGESSPVSVADIAAELRLHVNTAREHLDGLVAAGLATRTQLTPKGRGRPGWGYTACPRPARASSGEYVALAGVLAEHVASQGGDVGDDMARLGRGWGARLMAARITSPDHGDEGSERASVELLADLGFDPEVGHDVTRLRQCPMLDVAREHPEIVCEVHRGLVEGAVETSGGDPSVVTLEAFAERGACLVRFRHPAD